MKGITNDTLFGLLIMGAWLALGFKLLWNNQKKRAEEKRKAERAAMFKARRDERDDKRPMMVEQLEMEIASARKVMPHGADEAREINAIYARIVMEDDLGRYAEGPRPYEMDQAHRDILLAHARRDAAEALATSRTLLLEVRKLTSTLHEINRALFWLLFWLLSVFLLWSWWKSGFALWWQ